MHGRVEYFCKNNIWTIDERRFLVLNLAKWEKKLKKWSMSCGKMTFHYISGDKIYICHSDVWGNTARTVMAIFYFIKTCIYIIYHICVHREMLEWFASYDDWFIHSLIEEIFPSLFKNLDIQDFPNG